MRGLKTWACAVVFAASASPALAQTTGGTGGISGTTTRSTTSSGGTSLGSSSLGSSSLGSSSLGSSSLGSSSLSGGNSSGNSGLNGLSSLDQGNTAYTNIGITSSSSLQKSNVFAGFYANPYAMGLSSSSGAGGFGQALYGTTTTGTTGRGATGATGRQGSTGLTNSSNQSGILIPLPVQIAYTAQMRFPTPPVATPRLQADLRGIVDAGGLATPQNVQVIADANNNVTLRGTVKDDDEKRLTEGLVRLTPGVQNIINELTYPGMGK